MIVFVTGGTGFVGRAFLPQLLEALSADDEVRVLSRGPAAWPADPRIRPIAGDLETPDRWIDALDGVAWVFHIAADARFGQGTHYHGVNVAPVEAMLSRLQNSDTLRGFVLVSTVGAVDRAPADGVRQPLTVQSTPHPTSDYGRSKRAAEELVERSGLPCTILRPGWVYGRGMRAGSHLNVMARMIRRKPWTARLGFPGRVPLIHVEDLARALVRCLNSPATLGKTYFAVTENRSLAEVWSLLHEALRDRRPGQFRFPSFRSVLGRLHSRLPLTVNNLFLDYLAADDPDFRRDLLADRPIRLEEGARDVAARYRPEGSWWIVTGANSGIGFALTAALREAGHPVVAVDRAVDRLSEDPGLKVIVADLTQETDLQGVRKAVEPLCLGGLINNAGIGLRGGLFDLPWETSERTVRINVLGTMHLTHLLKEQLVREGSVIVNIASSVAYHPLPGMSVYAASKAFLLNWSLAVSEELRETNLVVTYSPSGTRTNFQSSGGVRGANSAELLAPEAVARDILNTVRAERRHRLLGWKSRILVTLSYWLPVSLRLRLWGRLFAARR